MIVIIVVGLIAIVCEYFLLSERASPSGPTYISTISAWLLFASTALMLIGALTLIGLFLMIKIRKLPFAGVIFNGRVPWENM